MTIPINTRPRKPRPNTTRLESVILEMLYIPGLDTCGAEKDSTAHFQGVVEFSGLCGGFLAFGIEPVH